MSTWMIVTFIFFASLRGDSKQNCLGLTSGFKVTKYQISLKWDQESQLFHSAPRNHDCVSPRSRWSCLIKNKPKLMNNKSYYLSVPYDHP